LNSLRLFRASPEGFFSALDVKLKELKAQIDEIRAQLEGVTEIADSFIYSAPARRDESPAPTRWTFEARLPNIYFDDVFEAETVVEPKRWVGMSGRLAWTLRLPRAVQYDFAVQCVNFGSNEMRDTFRLHVNGTKYPWLEIEGEWHRTIILEAKDEAELEFELSVDPATRAPGVDVTFSFARIDIIRRG
jgi:hypothetical protein